MLNLESIENWFEFIWNGKSYKAKKKQSFTPRSLKFLLLCLMEKPFFLQKRATNGKVKGKQQQKKSETTKPVKPKGWNKGSVFVGKGLLKKRTNNVSSVGNHSIANSTMSSSAHKHDKRNKIATRKSKQNTKKFDVAKVRQ